MKFYITDRTDPIAMAYNHIYSSLFEDLDEEIPEDIAKHFVYPELLLSLIHISGDVNITSSNPEVATATGANSISDNSIPITITGKSAGSRCV